MPKNRNFCRSQGSTPLRLQQILKIVYNFLYKNIAIRRPPFPRISYPSNPLSPFITAPLQRFPQATLIELRPDPRAPLRFSIGALFPC
jgi:hypothetical protein